MQLENLHSGGLNAWEELESSDSSALPEAFSGRMEGVKQTGRKKGWKTQHMGKNRGWRKRTLVLDELPRLRMETSCVYVTVPSPLKDETEH